MRKYNKIKSKDYHDISNINAIFITLSKNQRKWEGNIDMGFRIKVPLGDPIFYICQLLKKNMENTIKYIDFIKSEKEHHDIL